MAINKENIKLFASQRLTDEDDGCGRATGNVVAVGQVNNLFRDISRIDRTVCDVSMRKVFVGVGTDNLELKPRYRISPWNWWEDDTPIDHALPESMVFSMSVEWSPEPEYNAVHVSGTYTVWPLRYNAPDLQERNPPRILLRTD